MRPFWWKTVRQPNGLQVFSGKTHSLKITEFVDVFFFFFFYFLSILFLFLSFFIFFFLLLFFFSADANTDKTSLGLGGQEVRNGPFESDPGFMFFISRFSCFAFFFEKSIFFLFSFLSKNYHCQHQYQSLTVDLSSAVGAPWRCGVLTTQGGIAGIGLGRLLGGEHASTPHEVEAPRLF